MAKSSRRNQTIRPSASRLHTSIGALLQSSPLFKNYRLYQEYPVNLINPSYSSGREKFDWVILDIKLVIEMHGEQHYMPVRFGGITQEEAESNFKHRVELDFAKRAAALAAGFTYVVFKYDEDITLVDLLSKIDTCWAEEDKKIPANKLKKPKAKAPKKAAKPSEDPIKRKERLASASEYRRKQYQLAKSRRKSK